MVTPQEGHRQSQGLLLGRIVRPVLVPCMCCGSRGVPLLQVCTSAKVILSEEDILELIGDKCDGVIGQVRRRVQLDLQQLAFAAVRMYPRALVLTLPLGGLDCEQRENAWPGLAFCGWPCCS